MRMVRTVIFSRFGVSMGGRDEDIMRVQDNWAAGESVDVSLQKSEPSSDILRLFR